MTKKSKKVYEFLMSKPGYIKWPPMKVQIALTPHIGYIPLKDVKSGLKEAKVYASLKEKVDSTVKKPVVIKFKFPEPQNTFVSHLNESKQRNTAGTYFITGCSHAPWQNKKMYESVFNYLNKEVKLQGLILAGDIVDLNSLSSHDKGKVSIPGVTLSWEYEQANKFLDEFDQLTYKDVSFTKDYVFGNHENRYDRVKKDSDIAKYGESLVSPTVGLNLIGRGYNVYEDWKNDSIHLGHHLDVCHGEFLNVHSAKKTIDTYRKSTLYFHTHRFQIFVEGLVGGWNMGFGGDINAPIFGFATRAMKSSWVNSCCTVTIDENGFYHVQPLMFINNKLIVNGKEY